MADRQRARGHRPEPGRVDRDLQGRRRSRRHRARGSTSPASRGTHAIGHTRMATEVRRHDRRLASVLDRQRHLPRAQRLALQPQPPARAAAAPWRALPDRERQRGRGRLSRLAHARRRHARAARWSTRSTISTASTPSSSARATASPCCAIRSPASRPSWPRPTTGSRSARSSARSRALPGVDGARIWEPAPATVYAWSRSLSMPRIDLEPRAAAARRAIPCSISRSMSLRAGQPAAARRRVRRLPDRQSARRACARLRARWRRSTSRSTAMSATTAPA